MEDVLRFYWGIPVLTRSWWTLSLGLTAAVSLDLIERSMLVFDWNRIYNHLELWRVLTCFCYAHGPLNQFHVLILIYLILNIGRPYELQPLNTGGGGSRADAAFAGLFCAILIATTVPLINQYGPTLAKKAGYTLFFRKMEPVFTRSLVYAILYLWSRRNPNARANINMVPMQAKYIPFAHVALGWFMNHRIHETVHGILVGHVFYYLTNVVPVVTQGRMGLETPQFLIDLCAERQILEQYDDEDEDDDGDGPLIPPRQQQQLHPHED